MAKKKTKQEILKDIEKLRTFKQELDAGLKKAMKEGFAEQALLSGKVKDILDETETTVGEFLSSFEDRIKKLVDASEEFEKKSKKTTEKTKQTTEKIKDFSKILKHLNKKIIDELPEREKLYEEVYQNIDQDRKHFEKTHGQYGRYSKKIQSEVDRINKAARKTDSLTDLSNMSKQLNSLREIMLDSFKDTAERASALRQIDKQKELLDKEVAKKSGYIHRSFTFLKKNKITIGALAAGITANNPLVMWAVEAFGNLGVERKKEEASRKRYKVDQLFKMRDFYENREDVQEGKTKGKGRRSASRVQRSYAGGDYCCQKIVKELKLQTQLLREIVKIDGDEFAYKKGVDAQNQRQREAAEQAAEEAAMEQKAADKENKEKEESWRLQEKERFKKPAEPERTGLAKIWDMFKDYTVVRFLVGGLSAFLLPLLKMALPIMAVGGALKLAYDFFKSKEKSRKYGTGQLASAGSAGVLPAAGALAGSIVPGVGTVAGFALGSLAQAILPEEFQKEIAGTLQYVIDSLKIFWEKTKIVIAWFGDMFADLGAEISKMQMKLRFIVLDAKAYINKSLGMEIFDEKKLDRERQGWLQAAHQDAIKRNAARKERAKNVVSADMAIRNIESPPEAVKAVVDVQQKEEEIKDLQQDIAASRPTDPETFKKIEKLKLKFQELKGAPAAGAAGGEFTGTPEEWAEVMPPKQGELWAGMEEEVAPKEESPKREVAAGSQIPINFDAYAQNVGKTESGGRYGAVNSLGYVGKYQMGAMALEDAGLLKKGASKQGQRALDDPSNWTIAGGKEAFLRDSELQEKTFQDYTDRNYRGLQRRGVINEQSSPAEVAGALKAAHLGGVGGAARLMAGKETTDAYGTSTRSYYAQGAASQSGTYMAANNANANAKMNVATRGTGSRPIVVANNNAAPSRKTAGPAPSTGVNRAAPRGNEPALQTALNTDFSGSTA